MGAQYSAPHKSREGCLLVRLRRGMLVAQARNTERSRCSAGPSPSIALQRRPLADARKASVDEVGRADACVCLIEAGCDMNSFGNGVQRFRVGVPDGASGDSWKCLPLPPPPPALHRGETAGGGWGQVAAKRRTSRARPAAPQGLLGGASGASGSRPSSRRQTSQ